MDMEKETIKNYEEMLKKVNPSAYVNIQNDDCAILNGGFCKADLIIILTIMVNKEFK